MIIRWIQKVFLHFACSYTVPPKRSPNLYSSHGLAQTGTKWFQNRRFLSTDVIFILCFILSIGNRNQMIMLINLCCRQSFHWLVLLSTLFNLRIKASACEMNRSANERSFRSSWVIVSVLIVVIVIVLSNFEQNLKMLPSNRQSFAQIYIHKIYILMKH